MVHSPVLCPKSTSVRWEGEMANHKGAKTCPRTHAVHQVTVVVYWAWDRCLREHSNKYSNEPLLSPMGSTLQTSQQEALVLLDANLTSTYCVSQRLLYSALHPSPAASSALSHDASPEGARSSLLSNSLYLGTS